MSNRFEGFVILNIAQFEYNTGLLQLTWPVFHISLKTFHTSRVKWSYLPFFYSSFSTGIFFITALTSLSLEPPNYKEKQNHILYITNIFI